MRWQKIPAILLVLILLAGSFALAEGENAAQPTPAPTLSLLTVEPVATAEPTAEPSTEPTPAPAPVQEKQQLYYVLVDCGYTLFGSTAFDNSSVEIPGDPKGEVLSMLKEYAVDLLPETANIVVKGYHSDVVAQNAVPVPVSELGMVEAQFAALLGESEGARQSSKLDAALSVELETIKSYAANYDCTVVIVTGGAMGYYSDAPEAGKLAANIDAIRASGAKIIGFGLNGEDLLKNGYASEQYLVANAFAVDEYNTAEIADVKKSDGYAAARIDMMADLVEVLAAGSGATIDRFSAASNDEVLAKLETIAPTDTIYTFGWHTSEENGDMVKHSRYNSEGLKAFLAENDISGLRGNIFVVCGGKNFADIERRRTEEEAKKQLIVDMQNAMGILREKLAAPIDKVDGVKTAQILPENYNPERVTIKSDNAAVMEVSVDGSNIVITPKMIGSANVVCEVKGASQPMTAAVTVINTNIEWSWDDAATFTLVNGTLKDSSNADVTLSASISDKELYWTIESIQGESAIDSVSGNTLVASEEAPRSESGESGAIKWTEDNTPGQKSIAVNVSGMGKYNVICEVRDGETTLRTENRTFTVHAPIDAIEDKALIYPYFKAQDGQNVALTCGGAAVNVENYTVTVTPEEALSVYANADGSGLYLVARKAGDATVTVTENGVENPASTAVNVHVKSLMANPLLWVCGIGAVVCLIGLTAAIVILIGKSVSKSTKERTRR